MSSIQSRKEEIAAKKAKLAELKRQRELRQRDFGSRASIGDADVTEAISSPLRHRHPNATSQPGGSGSGTSGSGGGGDDLDSLISSLVDRPSSSAATARSPQTRPTQRTSGITSGEDSGVETPPPSRLTQPHYQDASTDAQPLDLAGLTVVDDAPVDSKAEIITYSKGVQTTEAWQHVSDESSEAEPEPEGGGEGERSADGKPRRRRRKLSKRAQQLDEEDTRQRLRQEIDEELRALKLESKAQAQLPPPLLPPDELNTLTTSNDFLDFIERSSKVVERALDEDYDVLADYALQARNLDDNDGDDGEYVGRRGRRIKQVAQFDLSDSMGRRRIISAIDFSPKFPELLCTAYTKSQQSSHTPPGLLNVWNLHLKGRPEYSLHATSDLLSALWHPYHPSLLLGGTYSGQLCLWDTRTRHQRTGEPVQKTPLSGGRTGHAHPIYSLAVVGTQNASSIISVSTDGVVCAWSTDMLTLPQEYLELHSPHPATYKTDDVAPTCLSFPPSDPSAFLAGTEQGAILPVHRYDRAGAKAGVDARVRYAGHDAPVTAIDFHPARGKLDLGDLFLSAGFDWCVKLWRARPLSALGGTSSSSGGAGVGGSSAATAVPDVQPLLTIPREDTVYDVRWHPQRPGIFGLVDGAGLLDVYDLNVSAEVPVGSAQPSGNYDSHYTGSSDGGYGGGGGSGSLKSLNKLAWEKTLGKQVGVGGLEGVATVFEVGDELGGLETRSEAWMGVRKWVGRQARGKGDV